jgi:hypothetical protein
MQQQYSCPNCGEGVPYGAKFCGHCGTELSWPDAAAETLSDRQETSKNNSTTQSRRYYKPPRSGGSVIPAVFLTILITLIVVFVGVFVVTRGAFFPMFYNLISSSFQTSTPSPTPTPSSSNVTQETPVIVFRVDPNSIIVGQKATLSWNVTKAVSASIDHGIGNVPLVGTQDISPTATTIYTMTAASATENVTSAVTLTVNPLPLPVINSFTVVPATINPGQSATLQWNVSGATTIVIDKGIGGVIPIGSRFVSPTTTTTYILTATNPAGSKSSSATVAVTQPSAPTIVSFAASPDTVSSGGSTTLSWNVSGATSISIDQGIGDVTSIPSKSKQVTSITQTTTFTLTAANTAGSVTSTVTVSIAQSGSGPTINSFTLTPPIFSAGSYVILTWNVSNADTVSINQGIGIVGLTGTLYPRPTSNTVYTLTAQNAAGRTIASATATVALVGLPVITNFYVTPTNIISSQNATMVWSVAFPNLSDANNAIYINPKDNFNTNNITYKNGIGVVSGNFTASANTTATYTLLAVNSVGSLTASATLVITPTGTGVPIINWFYAQPVTINPGSSAQIFWDVLGATSISIDQGIGVQYTNGIEASSYVYDDPPVATTYTITAGNSNGSATANVTVIVGGIRLPVIRSFTADKGTDPTNRINPGEPVTLSWIVDGAISLSISPDPGTQQGIVTQVVYPTGPSTTYTLTATNIVGSVTTKFDGAPATITLYVR